MQLKSNNRSYILSGSELLYNVKLESIDGPPTCCERFSNKSASWGEGMTLPYFKVLTLRVFTFCKITVFILCACVLGSLQMQGLTSKKLEFEGSMLNHRR